MKKDSTGGEPSRKEDKMKEVERVSEYWRDKYAGEYRRLHRLDCELLPEIKRRNEHWLEECSAAEALALLAGTPGASECSQCLPEEP